MIRNVRDDFKPKGYAEESEFYQALVDEVVSICREHGQLNATGKFRKTNVNRVANPLQEGLYSVIDEYHPLFLVDFDSVVSTYLLPKSRSKRRKDIISLVEEADNGLSSIVLDDAVRKFNSEVNQVIMANRGGNSTKRELFYTSDSDLEEFVQARIEEINVRFDASPPW